MTHYFLKRVRIEGFRGINNSSDPLDLKFKPDAVNSVFGPNGLGKSSVFDALSYAIKGSIPKLDGLPHAENANEYYCNRFHVSGTATILLTLKPNDGSPDIEIRVTRDPSGSRSVDSPSGDPNPESLLESLASEFVLLDQNTFLKFVEDSPLHRGRTFSGLLGLAKLSEVRQVLQTLSNAKNLKSDFGIRTLETEIKNAQQRRDTALQRIRTEFKSLTSKDVNEPIDTPAVITELQRALRVVELLKPHLDTTSIGEVNFDKLRESIRTAEKSDLRDELTAVGRDLSALNAVTAKGSEKEDQDSLRTLIKERDDALIATCGPLLPAVYSSTLKVLQSSEWEDPNVCPACEARHDGPIASSIEERQAKYQTVDRCQRDIAAQWRAMAWTKRFANIEQCASLDLREDDKRYSDFDKEFSAGTVANTRFQEAVGHLAELDEKIRFHIDRLTSRKEEIERLLPPSLVSLTQQIQHAEELVKQVHKYEESQQTLAEFKNQLNRREAWMKFIDDASKTFAEAEVGLSTSIATSIESDYQSMYREVTKNPDVVPKLKRSAGSEELHLRLEKFFGLSDVSATTLLQESYRNALAISIFLCTALRTTAPGRFIVLDDVTSSFDSGHQFALMELLRNQIGRPARPDGPQIILLSHDGLLEKYFDKSSDKVGWHHQKLQGMPPHGAVLSQSQSVDRLRTSAETFLNAGEVEAGAPLLRQYLEYSLLRVIRKVSIPVPLDFSIRDDRKMVENALNAILDAVKIQRVAGSLVLDSSQYSQLDTVIVPSIIGNWVTHYATGATSSLSPHVLLSVLNTVDEFVDCFRYDCSCSGSTCRRFYKSLSHKHCGC